MVTDIINFDDNKRELVCPFRTLTRSYQTDNQEVIQEIIYPKCHYEKCPYYGINKCLRI